MKYLLFLLLLVQCKTKTKDIVVVETAYPKSVGYVNDFAHILTAEQVILLDSAIDTFKKETTNEIAVVTIDSLPSDTTKIEHYSIGLANTWGIGNKEYNNGLLFLFAMKERKMRIETGKGLEKILTNNDCTRLIDSILKPHFKNAEYYTGIKLATDSAMAHLRARTNFKPL